jgi:hypothetical protein
VLLCSLRIAFLRQARHQMRRQRAAAVETCTTNKVRAANATRDPAVQLPLQWQRAMNSSRSLLAGTQPFCTLFPNRLLTCMLCKPKAMAMAVLSALAAMAALSHGVAADAGFTLKVACTRMCV